MRYHLKATINYPESEADTPDREVGGALEVLKWLHDLLAEPKATSFVVTIVKGKADGG